MSQKRQALGVPSVTPTVKESSQSVASVVEFGVAHERPGEVVWSSETHDDSPSVPSVSVNPSTYKLVRTEIPYNHVMEMGMHTIY